LAPRLFLSKLLLETGVIQTAIVLATFM